MKQYFLKNGIVLKDARVQREHSVCKGCLCIPEDQMMDDFLLHFSHGLFSVHRVPYPCICNCNGVCTKLNIIYR